MKKLMFSLLVSLSIWTSVFAIDASVSTATFTTMNQNYIEIYTLIVGSSVNFVSIDSDSINHQASVQMMVTFRKDSTIVKFDKYNLQSPISKKNVNFIDLKRISLENGEYEMEVYIHDNNKIGNAGTFKSKVIVDYKDDRLEQSDIQLLGSFKKQDIDSPFNKNGFYLEALPFNFYGKKQKELMFYNEIYNADKFIGDDYMFSYIIEKVSNVSDNKQIIVGHKKRKPKPIDVVLMRVDISELPSGNYNFIVEIRNRAKDLLSKRSVFFQRANPQLVLSEEEMNATALENEFVGELSDEDLEYSLRALAPVVDQGDSELLNLLIAGDETEAQKRFLYAYWSQKHPTFPQQGYDDYMKVARAIDNAYQSGFGFGFETDRGYVYMKYGQPDDIVAVDTEPTAPPYEIWIYNRIPQTGQPNVKFLFYNPSLSPGNYQLLHSNGRGELQNRNWKYELYKDSPNNRVGSDFNGDYQIGTGVGRRAEEYFNDY